MQILAAIIAFCKSITALHGLATLLERLAEKYNEKQSSERLDAKNAAVDSAIDNVVRAHKTEQCGSSDQTTGLSGSSNSGTGVVPGRPKDNQPS